jgi:heme-degrading monooxygenase HmoA
MKILRRWTARATAEKADRYVQFFDRVLRPELGALPGFLSATVSTHASSHVEVTITVVTRWASMAAVRGFAPDDRAVVEDEARALLTSFDDRVVHEEERLFVGPRAT